MGDAHLTTGLAALSRFFVGDGDLADTLERVAHLTVEAIDPAEACGITMLVEGHPRTIASTTEPGPWPEFLRAAADQGIHSTLSLPLVVGDASVGAMNLYATEPEVFDEPARQAATLFASHAAIVLANAQAYWDAHDLSTGLGEAMEHRAVIEQAKGILMGSQGCDEEAAFQLLVRASQRENVKLRDVARRIVEAAVARGRAGPDGAPPPGR